MPSRTNPPANYGLPAALEGDRRPLWTPGAIINEQKKLLNDLDIQRHQLLRRGYQLHTFDLTRNNSKARVPH